MPSEKIEDLPVVKGHGIYRCPECDSKGILYFYNNDYKSNMGTCRECLTRFLIKYDNFYEGG